MFITKVFVYCSILIKTKQKMENLKTRINEFLEDYNSLLDGLNDELSGIEDMGLNKKAKSLKDVKLADLECDEYLDNEYYEIKKLIQ